MSTELQRARKRQSLIFLLVCGGMIALLGRLYYWQIIRSAELSEAAQIQHMRDQIVNAPRGLIFDIHGMWLATNVVRDDVYIEPIQFMTNHEDDFAAAYTDYSQKVRQVLPEVSEQILQDAMHSGLQTVRIASQVEPEQSQRLRELRLQYTFLEPRTWRIYPGNNLASQILGYVQDGQGIYGIEGKYDKQLAGQPGSLSAETDLNGNPLTVGSRSGEEAVPGVDLTLTVDSYIQYLVEQGLADVVTEMRAQSGTALVLDARTGAVVAMAGFPDFDPNRYSDFVNDRGCINQQGVFFHPALYCDYEPGSTMKAITMATALDQKVVTPESTIEDPGYLTFDDGTPAVYNWNHAGHGTETMSEILQYSSNVGAATLAVTLGPDRYYPYLERFGFRYKTSLFDPEAPGTYRTPESPAWTKSDLTRQAFGQSLSVTPLQVAQAYQALANNGVLQTPYLVEEINENGKITQPQPQKSHRVIQPETAEAVTQMLIDTAVYNNIEVAGYQVAAKSGTATTQGLDMDQTVASMVGYLPASDPRFVVLVKIDRPEENIYGSGAAGPLWMSIAQQLMVRYSIPPDQS